MELVANQSHFKKSIFNIAVAGVLGTVSLSADAALTNSTILNFNAGTVGGTTKPAVGTGSWFSMKALDNGPIDGFPDTTLYTTLSGNNGLHIGVVQAASGSHGYVLGCDPSSGPCTGAGGPGEAPNIDSPWVFFGSTGMHNTTSAVTVTTDSGVTKILDFTGWNINWNTITSIPLGGDATNFASDTGLATIVCSSSTCSASSTFSIDFSTHTPVGDPSGFGGLFYEVHLEGHIKPDTTCGNGPPAEAGEECDDGNAEPLDLCDTAGSNPSSNGECTFTFCGDGGTQEPNGQGGILEDCDDGNTSETDQCSNGCQFTFCGDDKIQNPNGVEEDGLTGVGDEECEDGNNDGTDECDATGVNPDTKGACTFTFCGDGEIQDLNGVGEDGLTGVGDEECDDGNGDGEDQCDTEAVNPNNDKKCTFTFCGDGKKQTQNGLMMGGENDDGKEDCDEGSTTDECDTEGVNPETKGMCTFTFCGDGMSQTPNGLGMGGENDDGNEECDEVDTTKACDTEGMNPETKGTCTFTFCGDGTIQNPNGSDGTAEICDDGNANPLDLCDTYGVNPATAGLCMPTYCGDGGVQSPNGIGFVEQCDDLIETASCDSNCTLAICGDGTLNTMAGEACDDGNAVDGDGCSAVCQLETQIEEDIAATNSTDDCDTDGIRDSGDCRGKDLKNRVRKNGIGGSQAVLPHSGQEVRTETDFSIKGRDPVVDLEIKRRHLTRINHEDSPFGPAWAFGYHHVFAERPDHSIEMHSFGRSDNFHAAGTNTWDGGMGRFDRLSFDGLNTATLRMPGGTILSFYVELVPISSLLVGHLTAITSAKGNSIVFTYETQSQESDLQARKLLTITESYGRDLDFFYEDADFPDAVSRIRDFSGREYMYDYNASGQLLSVRSPVVTSTGGLNDFAAGKTTQYTYLNHANPKLANALTAIIFPNQQAAGSEPRLGWAYDTNEASEFFGYVTSHDVGNPGAGGGLAAGGTYSYAYQALGSTDVNDPAVRTTISDRRNTVTTMELNATGQPLKESIATQGFRSGAPGQYERSFSYNDDGDMIQFVDAMGTTTMEAHPPSGTRPRNSQANETEHTWIADARGGDQVSITVQTIYEPIFNRPFKRIDPRGFEVANSPAQFTTTYLFDYMEDLAAAKALFAPQLGITPAELQDLFDEAGITDLGTDVNGDGIRNQTFGNVITVFHPQVLRPSQAARVGLGPIEQAVEIKQFNDFGQVTKEIDAEENVTLYEYFGAHDPDGNGVVDVPGANTATGGYLRKIVWDATAGTSRNSNQDPAPVAQTTSYEYTGQGTFPENLRGLPTAMVDPRGIKHTYLVNEMDENVVETRAADTSASSEVGLIPFAYQTLRLYDFNGNIVEKRIQNKDTLDGANDSVVYTYHYDILDQRTRETLDDSALTITNTFAYDPSQNLVQKVRGLGATEQAVESWLYDERDILVSHSSGVGTPEVSTTTTKIDDNGNIVQTIDADGADVNQIVLDGFDRKKELIDRVGNRQVFTYDSASNVISTQDFGPPDELSGETLLAQSDRTYDERNRLFRTDQHIFHYPGKSVGTIDDGALDPGDGMVSSITIHDRLSRVVGVVDADDDTFEFRYDGLGRAIQAIDPLGNQMDNTYDPNNNLIVVAETEVSPLVSDEIFVGSSTYDSLNRQTSNIESNGQTTQVQYDSRDNVIRTIDALGNQVEMRYDRINRLVDTRTYLSGDGANASASNADSSQGGGDGVIIKQQSWDDLHRIVAQTDDNGQTTTYTYDDLDRRVHTDYQDGTSEAWNYNPDSELLTHTNQNGSIESWIHDEESRLTQVTIDNSGSSTTVLGTTQKTWGYDGLDRITRAFDNNGAGEDVEYSYIYDSLSRQLRETQAIGSRVVLNLDQEWQGATRQVSATYPNGRQVSRTYDGLDRLTDINESAGGGLIADFQYIGSFRDVLTSYGNGTTLDKRNSGLSQTSSGNKAGYDSNRRLVRHEWKSGADQITAYINKYNGAGGIGTNRRRSENRLHLGHQDRYQFDSDYRMISFVTKAKFNKPGGNDSDSGDSGNHGSSSDSDSDSGKNKKSNKGKFNKPEGNNSDYSDSGKHGSSSDSDSDSGKNKKSNKGKRTFRSKRRLDGVDNMIFFKETGNNRKPLLDSILGEEGMNQYSKFDGNIRNHDDNANLGDDGQFKYLYDYQNRLIEVRETGNDALVSNYLYTANNRRVLRTVGANTTRYLYNNWQICEERDGGDNVLRQYVDGRGIDEHIQLKDYTEVTEPVYFYHTNSQGFTGALTDDNGDVVEYYEYAWLGRPTILDTDKTTVLTQSKIDNEYMFQGRRLDKETGLYYYRNRYYSPESGRFLQFDPLGMWNHGQGNGFSAFAEDGWNRGDALGLDLDDEQTNFLRSKFGALEMARVQQDACEYMQVRSVLQNTLDVWAEEDRSYFFGKSDDVKRFERLLSEKYGSTPGWMEQNERFEAATIASRDDNMARMLANSAMEQIKVQDEWLEDVAMTVIPIGRIAGAVGRYGPKALKTAYGGASKLMNNMFDGSIAAGLLTYKAGQAMTPLIKKTAQGALLLSQIYGKTMGGLPPTAYIEYANSIRNSARVARYSKISGHMSKSHIGP